MIMGSHPACLCKHSAPNACGVQVRETSPNCPVHDYDTGLPRRVASIHSAKPIDLAAYDTTVDLARGRDVSGEQVLRFIGAPCPPPQKP